MSNQSLHTNVSFPLILTCDSHTIFNNPTIGSHKQFIVRANGIELAMFMDEYSAKYYVDFLKECKFDVFNRSEQGRALLNLMLSAHERVRLENKIVDGVLINDPIFNKHNYE